MKLYRNYPLIKYNAFHVDVKSKYFSFLKDPSDIQKLIKLPILKQEKIYILGESASSLFRSNFNGLVLKTNLKGIKIIKSLKKSSIIEISAGESWDKVVLYSIRNNLSGIENLSGIPGTAGAAPVQNIAAYGQNFEDVFVSLDAVELSTGKISMFDKTDCKFGYRDSIFKNSYKNKFLIISIRIKLSKFSKLNTQYYSRYESLKESLFKYAKPPYTLKDIRRVVLKIRKSKFPNWKVFGNTGSYFKNPVISVNKLLDIQKKYPGLQYYPVEKLMYSSPGTYKLKSSDKVKIAAGWLLEEIGWKGKRIGNVGTSPNQSMIIINYGKATAVEIINFAEKMRLDFKKHFGVNLETEVNII